MNFEVNARDLHGAGVDGTRVLAPVLVPDLSDVQVPVAHISVFDGNSGIVNEPPLIFTYQYFLWIHPYHLKINEEKNVHCNFELKSSHICIILQDLRPHSVSLVKGSLKFVSDFP